MGTAIIVLILVIMVALAVKNTMKHFRGEGGCCGGGDPAPKVKKKRLKGKIVATRTFHVEGMHCNNCKNRIEAAVNAVDELKAAVNLEKKEVTIQMTTLVSDEELIRIIQRAGYIATL